MFVRVLRGFVAFVAKMEVGKLKKRNPLSPLHSWKRAESYNVSERNMKGKELEICRE